MPVKTVAKHKSIDLAEAVAYMTESIAEMSRKMAKSSAETEAKMAKSSAETEAKMAKSSAETEAKMAKSSAETEAKMAESRRETEAIMAKSSAETEAKMAESRRETEAIMAKSKAEMEKAIKEMTQSIRELTADVKATVSGFGTMGRRFGEIVELVVIPGVRRAINPFGHDFKRAAADKKFTEIGRNGQKRLITEVDLFLSNGTEAMAVEIKATLRDTYVTNHLNRLKLLREYEKAANLTNKRLYGAVAGIYIEPEARAIALKNGLYVIDILEDENMLGVDKPAQCRIW